MERIYKVYGTEPIEIVRVNCHSDEMFFYQYLPVVMPGEDQSIKLPTQLDFLYKIVVAAVKDFVRQFGWEELHKNHVSRDQYNLKGNSHNYKFDYKWEMKDRETARNHPSK